MEEPPRPGTTEARFFYAGTVPAAWLCTVEAGSAVVIYHQNNANVLYTDREQVDE